MKKNDVAAKKPSEKMAPFCIRMGSPMDFAILSTINKQNAMLCAYPFALSSHPHVTHGIAQHYNSFFKNVF